MPTQCHQSGHVELMPEFMAIRPVTSWSFRATGAMLAGAVAAMAPQAATSAPKAEANADAEVLARTATEPFKLRQFERAAQLFVKAYGKSRKTALMFNAARAYEEAGKLGDLAALFRLYWSIADDPDGIAEARSASDLLRRAARLRQKPRSRHPVRSARRLPQTRMLRLRLPQNCLRRRP